MEKWKEILGLYDGLNHIGYFVSNLGNIKTIDRYVESGNRWGKMRKFYKGRDKVKSITKAGYLRIELSGGKMYSIHRLVGYYFVNGYKEKLVINHIDGNKSNNIYSNLEWCTSSQNELHSHYVLNKQPANKIITDEQAYTIRDRVKNGTKQNAIAKEYDVSKSTINAIVSHRSHNRNDGKQQEFKERKVFNVDEYGESKELK